MRKLANVVEVEGEGLEALLGEKIFIMCSSYFYTGVLEGVNTNCVLLKNPSIVYETGAWSEKAYKDMQSLNKDSWYVMIHAIESFGLAK